MLLNRPSNSKWKIGIGLCAATLGLFLLAANFNGLSLSVVNPPTVHAAATARPGHAPPVHATAEPNPPPPVSSVIGGKEWHKAQEDNVCEAVFRREIARHSGYIHYLSIRQKDPTPTFMRRFDPVTVRPDSQTKNIPVSSFNKILRDQYSVDTVLWITNMKVDVEGSDIQLCGRAGGFGVYHLKFIDGRWIVVDYTSTGII